MISCKEYATHKKEELKARVEAMDRKPCLAVVQIGNDSASESYIKGKKKDCEEVGIMCAHKNIKCDEPTEAELVDFLKYMDEQTWVDGIIIQLPIPDKYDVEKLQNCISPEKDVDGFRRDSHFKPCTPKGIMDWLDYNNYDLEGKEVVVAGRSKIVGKPLVNMLIDRGATVTCINSKTKHPINHTFRSDLFVSAIGKPKHWTDFDFYRTEIIVDVGINRNEDGKLCGDVDRECFDGGLYGTYVTPVPNGVGLLTRVALLENVVASASRRGVECG